MRGKLDVLHPHRRTSEITKLPLVVWLHWLASLVGIMQSHLCRLSPYFTFFLNHTLPPFLGIPLGLLAQLLVGCTAGYDALHPWPWFPPVPPGRWDLCHLINTDTLFYQALSYLVTNG